MPVFEDDELYEGDDVSQVAEGVEETTSELRIEQQYVAQLLARPDLLDIAGATFHDIGNGTLRAMLQVVASHGAAYAKPLTMLNALDALPQDVDPAIATATLSLVPEPDEVDLGPLTELGRDVSGAARNRKLKATIDRSLAMFGKRPAEMVIGELRSAIDEYDRRGLSKMDHSAKAAIDRLRNSPPKMRWKIGYKGVTCVELDDPFKGIGPDGQAGYGMLGQNEVVVLAAGYGVGKTRVVDNWKTQLFYQPGTSVATVMLEDDETANITKLMGIHADVPFWMVEQYARGEMGFLGANGLETQRKLDETLAWYESLGDRHRVYDGSHTEADVFDFEQCLRLLEFDIRVYKTTHIVIDYVQAFGGGEETEKAAAFAQRLRALAGRYRVCLIEISQVSNDTMKFGSAAGQVAAKGSGAWGQAAHIGIELEWDADVGQREICLNLKKARNARRRRVYAAINEDSGQIQAYYGTPIHMSLPDVKKPAAKGAKK